MYNQPDHGGHFDRFGGKYVPETLIPAIDELENLYAEVKDDPDFISELDDLLKSYSGRPTPLYYASRLSAELGFNVFLKREDLCMIYLYFLVLSFSFFKIIIIQIISSF